MHAGSRNHGCEAIVRSTVSLFGQNNQYLLYSKNKAEDIEYNLDDMVDLRLNPKTDIISPSSLRGYLLRVNARLSHKDYDLLDCLRRNKGLHEKNSIALSIGGDNYCYRSIINELRDNINALTHWNIPIILWGCSVSSKTIGYSLKDLKKYQLIVVRETVSQHILEESHANDKIILCCDPAFHLSTQPTRFVVINDNPIIGINVSAFMGYYEAYPNATFNNFKRLVQYILDNTNYNVALIPHVVHDSYNNDNIPIKNIKKCINDPRLIIIPDNLNCMQIKSLISQCKLFVGCRTHSTIAAYSSNVPALVAGYSEKAIGIARDLFGDEKGLVLPVQNFQNDDSMTFAFCEFMEREDELRKRLISFIPEYKKSIFKAVEAVKELGRQI